MIAKFTTWLRRNVKVIFAALVVIPVLSFAYGPIGAYPGLVLGGTSLPAPDDWTVLDAEGELLIETRSSFPYVVKINYLATGRGLYVVALRNSVWRNRIRANPDVRIRVVDSTYEMRAYEVPKSDVEQFQSAIDAYCEKFPELVDLWGTELTTIENFRFDLLRLEPRVNIPSNS